MNGKDFQAELAKQCHVTQKEAGAMIKAFTKLIRKELADGGSVTLTGLGRFYTTAYQRKNIVTPQGKKMEIKPHNVARFAPCKELKRIVAGKV